MKNKAKALFSSRAFRSGSYAVALSAIAVAICVLVNIVVTALPSRFTSFDLTSTGLFSLSDESEKLVQGLKSPVEIYYLAQTGQEDMAIASLLDKYKGLSSNIRIETKDPVLYPTFAAKYEAEGVSSGSLIVVSGEKSQVINSDELYEQIPNYTTYAYDTSFAGEARITSAISYVTRELTPKIYILSGHDTLELSTSAASALSRKHYEVAELNLISEGEVPTDASCIILNAPTKDLTDAELIAIRNYLNSGKSLFLSSIFKADTNMPNLYTLLSEYGMSFESGIIIEGNTSMHVKNYPEYLMPTINSHAITTPLLESDAYTLMPLAFPITLQAELPQGVTALPLLTTSSQSYLKLAGYEAKTLEKESGDIDGPFNVAVLAEKTDGDKTGTIAWFSTDGILDETANSMVAGSNTDLFLNSLAYLCAIEDDISISVKAVSSPIIVIPQGLGNFLSALVTFIIPLALIICGFLIWLKRRRR